MKIPAHRIDFFYKHDELMLFLIATSGIMAIFGFVSAIGEYLDPLGLPGLIHFLLFITPALPAAMMYLAFNHRYYRNEKAADIHMALRRLSPESQAEVALSWGDIVALTPGERDDVMNAIDQLLTEENRLRIAEESLNAVGRMHVERILDRADTVKGYTEEIRKISV